MGEQKDRMLRGEWYLDEPDLAEERRRCWRMLDSFNATDADDDPDTSSFINAYRNAMRLRNEFYAHARADLDITSGPLPELTWRSRQPSPPSPDHPATP